MDSLSQAALGAAVGVVVMGRERPVWQALLAGAVIGTLPDLDVFIDKGDAVSNMVLHRAETHAFFWQLLVSLPIAVLLAWVTRSTALWPRWWMMVLAGFFTHSMLDAMTIYGTRIWLPFDATPAGLGSLFIIDPLFTLPLVLGLIFTAILRHARRRRWTAWALAFSTLYAGWSVAAQAYVTNHVMSLPEAAGIDKKQLLVTPTPFNTLLWRVVIREENQYHEGFYSLLDPFTGVTSLGFRTHDRGGHLEARSAQLPAANQIRAFSKGFYGLRDDGRYLYITDLRMGQHPFYAFDFAVARHSSEPLYAIEPIQFRQHVPVDEGLDWLKRRMLGQAIDAPDVAAN